MTIEIYEGTPGSGKTLHGTEEGIVAMRRPGGVIANYEVTEPRYREDGTPKWLFLEQEEMTPAYLMAHAEKYHPRGKESQGTIIIDECHRVLNSRTTWTARSQVAKPQMELVRFLAEHRHFGYDVILIVQSLEMLDKHARYLVEYRTKHFKANSFWWLSWVPFPIFGRVRYMAQFRGMKGRLDFSLGLLTRGRYDYLAMRKRVAAAFDDAQRRLAAGSPPGLQLGLVGPAAGGNDNRSGAEKTSQALSVPSLLASESDARGLFKEEFEQSYLAWREFVDAELIASRSRG